MGQQSDFVTIIKSVMSGTTIQIELRIKVQISQL